LLAVFLPPCTELLPLSLGDEINLLTFLIASVVIVWATDHYRRLTKRLRDEENLRRLAAEELAHRLKNKVATIQSIVAFNLSAHPEGKRAIRSIAIACGAQGLYALTRGSRGPLAFDLAKKLAWLLPFRVLSEPAGLPV
jgi:hypothetical protein